MQGLGVSEKRIQRVDENTNMMEILLQWHHTWVAVGPPHTAGVRKSRVPLGSALFALFFFGGYQWGAGRSPGTPGIRKVSL